MFLFVGRNRFCAFAGLPGKHACFLWLHRSAGAAEETPVLFLVDDRFSGAHTLERNRLIRLGDGSRGVDGHGQDADHNDGLFFFLFQYLLLRADMRRYLAIYVIATMLAVCYLYYKERMLPWSTTRLGGPDGVHPNTIGLISAFATGACVMLIDKRWRLLWLVPLVILLGGIVLTISFGSLVIAAGLMVVMLLVRFPKKWGWKLAGLAALGAVAGGLVLFTDLFMGIPALAHVREVGLFFIKGEGLGGSTAERITLVQAAYYWFAQRPMTGWGLACFRFLEGSLGSYAHNNYIELLVSGGIPMLVIYYVGQIGALIYAARVIKCAKAEDPNNERAEERRTVYIFIVLMLAHLVMDIGGVTYYERHYGVYFVLLFAAARIFSASKKLPAAKE